MVLEQILDSARVKRHIVFIFSLAFLFVFVGYLVSTLFFGSEVSVAMLFTLTLLLSPSMAHLVSNEEYIERKEGIHHFFRNHKAIFKVYFFIFLGVFAGFFVLGMYGNYYSTFDYQIQFLQSQQGLTTELVDDYLQHGYTPNFENFIGLFGENIKVMLITFVLAIFYGAGSVFLVTLNASVFAAFLVFVINYFSKISSYALQTIGVFLIHLIPEITGFFLASLAGSLLSRAILVEKFGSRGYSNILKDCALLLCVAAFFTLLGSFLEVYVSSQLMRTVLG
ncbi:stage II sporulation protein M [Candidatus Woesearchaeota archaeon]|nr:stage II sporulation protein M [Candidatus Woesearchaeota archaeon]